MVPVSIKKDPFIYRGMHTCYAYDFPRFLLSVDLFAGMAIGDFVLVIGLKIFPNAKRKDEDD